MQRALAPLGRPVSVALARTTMKTPVVRSSTRALATKAKDGFDIVGADQTMSMQKVFHATSLVALAATPLALVAPGPLALPLDIGLSVLFPIHAHIGMSWIMTDYLPMAGTHGPVRMAMVAITGLAIVGCLKLSLTDVGLVGTLKATWSDPEEVKNRKN